MKKKDMDGICVKTNLMGPDLINGRCSFTKSKLASCCSSHLKHPGHKTKEKGECYSTLWPIRDHKESTDPGVANVKHQ